MVFAFLYGLSMDYVVFILSRIREEYDRGGSTDEAVIEGIGRTGRLVTSAALILFLAFVALASGPGTDLKTFASALGFGILLDATVVRSLLVPALVSMFGNWNWWLPDWAARALRVAPSEPHEEPLPELEPATPGPAEVYCHYKVFVSVTFGYGGVGRADRCEEIFGPADQGGSTVTTPTTGSTSHTTTGTAAGT